MYNNSTVLKELNCTYIEVIILLYFYSVIIVCAFVVRSVRYLTFSLVRK